MLNILTLKTEGSDLMSGFFGVLIILLILVCLGWFVAIQVKSIVKTIKVKRQLKNQEKEGKKEND